MNLKHELGKPDLKRDELFALYKRAIEERFSPKRIVFDGPDKLQLELAGGQKVTVFLDNLWIQFRNSSGGRIDVVEQHLAALASVAEPQPDLPVARENIVPIIKDYEYLALGNQDSSSKPVVKEYLAGDIWIVYAVDLPKAIQALTESQMQELHMKAEDLRELALQNLRRILPNIEQHGEGPWYVLTAGDYTASLLLVDKIWTQLEDSVEGDVIAAVPARDVLLFTGSRSKEGIEAVRRKTREIHEGGDHVVSQTLLRFTSGKWRVFE